MSDTATCTTSTVKRGDKQTIALKHMNSLPENYRFEDLTKAVGDETGLDEAGTRHLIRYMVKYQDRIDIGKKQTLRDQGRVIAPAWYTPVPNPKSVTDLEGRHIPFADFPLKKPEGRKSPTKKTEAQKSEAKAERRAAIIKAFANFNAKRTTSKVEEMAKAGAHRVVGTTQVVAPAVENVSEDA